MNIIQEIRSTIQLEKETLEQVIRDIDAEYGKAVKMIFGCSGKIIVTGVGKSGIIGQKIAATMVSTGTPAIFMHPAEGMHGDLGIIQRRDIVIAIGKSGESAELTGIIPSIRRIGAKIIAITANRHSTLARYADIVLFTRVNKEACPLNLAPTNSTTAALVVGDAIAVSLMKMRNFRKKDFALYHPGGKLGMQLLLKVGDVMRSGEKNPVIEVNDSVKKLLITLSEKMSGAVSVVDVKGRLVGLVTDYDIRKIIERGEDLFAKKIREIMNPAPVCVTRHTKAITALKMMEKRKRPILLMPVIDSKKRAVGLIHVHDILSKGL